MAERPSELNEEIETGISKTHSNDVFAGDLENRSTESFSTESSDADADEISAETEKIRTNIVETRSHMSETIDAIQEKLSLSNITEQVKDEVSEHITSAIQTAKDSVFDATLGKVGNIMNYVNKGMNELSKTDVAHATRKNPLAVTLIGVGLGMLAMNNYSKKRTKSYRYKNDNDFNKNDNDFDRQDNNQERKFSTRSSQSTIDAARDKVGDTAGKVGESISDAAGKVGESVSGAAGAVSDTVSDYAGKAYKQVSSFGSQAKDVVGSAQNQYEYYIEENPLAVGAVVLAIGAAVGMSLPSTRMEGDLMGDARNNLVHKAQETAREALGKVQKVAGSVTETVKHAAGDVAQSVKESAGEVVQKVKDSAGEVTQTAKDEANKQGLT